MTDVDPVALVRTIIRRHRFWRYADEAEIVATTLAREVARDGRGFLCFEGDEQCARAYNATKWAAVDLWRKSRRRRHEPENLADEAPDTTIPSPEDAAIEAEERKLTAAALALCRLLPTLDALLEGDSLSDIARRERVAPSTAMRRVRRELTCVQRQLLAS